MSSHEIIQIDQNLEVLAFYHNNNPEPLFTLREFDIKLLRLGKNKKVKSEQSARSNVRQVCKSLNLTFYPCKTSEISILKNKGILRKNDPSASLLRGVDMVHLLEFLNKKRHADLLQKVLKKKEKHVKTKQNECNCSNPICTCGLNALLSAIQTSSPISSDSIQGIQSDPPQSSTKKPIPAIIHPFINYSYSFPML